MIIKNPHPKNRGFTLIEIIVVVVVIAILAAIVMIGYGTWRTTIANKEVQSDLQLAASAMENARDFGSGYPTSLPTNFTSSPNVTVSYTSGDSSSYCIDGVSKTFPTIGYFVSSTSKTPISGTCVGGPGATPSGGSGGGGGGGGGGFATIITGTLHSCALTTTSQAYCWGDDTSGIIGDGDGVAPPSSPQPVSTDGVLSGKTINQIDASGQNTCVVASDNLAYCWGANNAGQLGNQSGLNYSDVPVAVTMNGVLAGKTIKQITSGSAHTCVIASDNKAYCWGYYAAGQLGNGVVGSTPVHNPSGGIGATTDFTATPVAVSTSGVLAGKTIKQIAAGLLHTCVIASDDKVYCWGDNDHSQLGDGGYGYSSGVPVAVDMSGALAGKTIKQLATGRDVTCVIASDDKAYCWGQEGRDWVNNVPTVTPSPVAIDTSGVLAGKTIKQIAINEAGGCVIASDNKAYCWGSANIRGDGSSADTDTPVAVSTSGVLAGKTLTYVSVGYSFACAIDTASKAYCWGADSAYRGVLGDGSYGSGSLVPIEVSNPF